MLYFNNFNSQTYFNERKIMADSKLLAQDVIICDLCDKPTQQFCNSCQVNVSTNTLISCNLCHMRLLVQKTGKHIVSYQNAKFTPVVDVKFSANSVKFRSVLDVV